LCMINHPGKSFCVPQNTQASLFFVYD
jgi:hypothetical protein